MSFVKRILGRGLQFLPEGQYSSPIELRSGHQGIYHIHVRKTAGTSLNHIFMGVSGARDRDVYATVAESLKHSCVVNGYKYVGYSRRSINRGNYFYAYSHLPYWRLNLPVSIYTYTCFRDPVDRVLSHYKMIKDYSEDGVRHPCMKEEGKWLGQSEMDFFLNMPRHELLNQLYMFSPSLNVNQALDMVSRIKRVLYVDSLESDLLGMSSDLGLALPYQHRRKTKGRAFSDELKNNLRELMQPEYNFLDVLRGELENV